MTKREKLDIDVKRFKAMRENFLFTLILIEFIVLLLVIWGFQGPGGKLITRYDIRYIDSHGFQNLGTLLCYQVRNLNHIYINAYLYVDIYIA